MGGILALVLAIGIVGGHAQVMCSDSMKPVQIPPLKRSHGPALEPIAHRDIGHGCLSKIKCLLRLRSSNVVANSLQKECVQLRPCGTLEIPIMPFS